MADLTANTEHYDINHIGTLMDRLAKALGIKIREQRKTCNLSQEALAHSCSIDRSYMGRIERGEVNITVEKLYVIAEVLECDPSTLLPDFAGVELNQP